MKSNSKGHWFSSPATRMLLQDLKRCGLEAEGIRSETQNDCRDAPVHLFFHILIEWTTLTTLALFEARAAMLLQASQFMHPKLSIIIQWSKVKLKTLFAIKCVPMYDMLYASGVSVPFSRSPGDSGSAAAFGAFRQEGEKHLYRYYYIYKYIYIIYIYEYIYIHTYSINDARDVWLSYPIQSKLNGKSAALIWETQMFGLATCNLLFHRPSGARDLTTACS